MSRRCNQVLQSNQTKLNIFRLIAMRLAGKLQDPISNDAGTSKYSYAFARNVIDRRA